MVDCGLEKNYFLENLKAVQISNKQNPVIWNLKGLAVYIFILSLFLFFDDNKSFE